MGFQKDLSALPPREFFMFVLLKSTHVILGFLVQFEITRFELKSFQKVEIALAKEVRATSAFWKTYSSKLTPN